MQIENITIRTKRMIDDLKTICANFGLGGSPGEYKIITQLSPEEFTEKMNDFASSLDAMFAESHRLEDEIKAQLGRVKYEH